jgi:hypothetical protein
MAAMGDDVGRYPGEAGRTARGLGRRLSLALAVALASSVALADAPPAPHVQTLDIHRWRVVQRESGPTDYYTIVAAQPPFVRALYAPGMETTVLGIVFTDAERTAKKVRWRWRAETLPTLGSECGEGREDSAASVYLTWKRGLRWYTLKYVWSPIDKVGSVCRPIRNPFVAQDTVVLESGGPVDAWATEEIDLKAEFRRHFADNDPNADVPDLLGVGIMSDGDQTNSASAADYGDFALVVP